jgi:2-dehydro-3-deoxygalactonokinase
MQVGYENMFIGVDWGTSNFRAYLFDGENVIDQIENENGVLQIEDFRSTIDLLFHKWPVVPVVFSGMVGSSIGWVEAPYSRVPICYIEILSSLYDVQQHWNRESYILGGLDYQKNEYNYDVMRGEELQILGLQKHVQQESIAVLLGTHSKHVRLDQQEILSFQTYLTGELFSISQKHSIFAGPIENNEEDFWAGVKKSQDGTLLGNLFSTRSLSLSNTIDYPRAFLSGLLIGTELRTLPTSKISTFIFVGSSSLLPLYKKTFVYLYGFTPQCFVTDQCNISGYIHVARHLHWIT